MNCVTIFLILNLFSKGIDFGMICGSATLDLPVPELVPFRLTPQLASILEPFGTYGLLYKSMVRVLETITQSRHIVLACINVFVRDPILDWFQLTYVPYNIEQNSSVKVCNLSQLRINSVQYKLDGYNSRNITIMDLENGIVR